MNTKSTRLALLILLVSFCQCDAQSPGNVGTTNLTAWFKTDDLGTGAATTWQTTYPTGASAITLTDATAPYPSVTNTPSDNVGNYNNTISFIGNTIAAPMSLELATTSLNLLDNRLSTSQGTLFTVYYSRPSVTTAQHIVDYRESNNDAIQLRGLNATNSRIAIGTTNATTCVRDYGEGARTMLFTYSGNRSVMKCRKRSLEWTNNPTSSSASTGAQLGLTIGARKSPAGVYSGPCDSYISEVIFFNTDLSPTNSLKVESYLAVKHGITLDPTGLSLGKYLASNGSETWNAATNLSYHQDVIGIGRDDNSALNQKQSHTFDDTTRIYLGSLLPNNQANGSNFSFDLGFMMIGRNNGAASETALATAEMPSGLNLVSRIEREWRVTNTNQEKSFSLDITLSSFANFTTLPANLCLLVDDDGDFSNACPYQTGMTFTVNGNVITVSGISSTQIPLNATRYITLGNITSLPLPNAGIAVSTSTSTCLGDAITLSLTNATTYCSQTYQWESSIDNMNFSPIIGASNATYTTNSLMPTYYQCKIINGASTSISTSILIVVNPLPVVTAIASPSTSICAGSSVTLQGSGALNYSWNALSTVGSDTLLSPAVAGTYTVVGTDVNGCTSASTVGIAIIPSCVSTLNLNCFIEGYWDGSAAMLPVLSNQNQANPITDCDTILVELHDQNSPYSTLYATSAILHTNGSALCTFNAAVTPGDYYIVVKHRNALQTWSANPVTIGATGSYNFTTALSQAYGTGSQVQVSPGVWAFYSGDVVTDENMDLLDLGAVETDASLFLFGYFLTDLTGDGNVDLLDTPIVELNAGMFIFAQHP